MILSMYSGIILGVILGIAVAFLIEYFNDSIRNQKEAEEELRLPVLASIPEFILQKKT